MSIYIIPLVFIFTIVYGKIKKVDCYQTFVCGAKKGFNLGLDLFPFIATILVAVGLFRASGLLSVFINLFSPAFNLLGIPTEICQLVFLKPFSGSGSLALLGDIFTQYGVDSYIGRCASVIMSSSETTFYIASLYLSKCQTKKLAYAIPVSLLASFVATIIACLLCRVI